MGMKSMNRITISTALFCSLVSTLTANGYIVNTGDTLSQIAEKQYGDWRKWKDLYTLNQDILTNSNVIYPGQRLKLLDEDQLDLYADNSAPQAMTTVRKSRHHSQEWRLLPKQSWERFIYPSAIEVDPNGFDRSSKIGVKFSEKIAPRMTVFSRPIPLFGEIVNARSEFTDISIQDQVFIHASTELQVGGIYSIVSTPEKISSKRNGRVGMLYGVSGKVRIDGAPDGTIGYGSEAVGNIQATGMPDQTYIATVISAVKPVERHQFLVPEMEDYKIGSRDYAPLPVLARILGSDNPEENLYSENSMVVLDVGAVDGIHPGVIFRRYLHHDPMNKEAVPAKEFIIEAELQVLGVEDHFSIALVLNCRRPLQLNDDVLAVPSTDLNHDLGTGPLFPMEHPTLDPLDQLDHADGLKEKDEEELKQLEGYHPPAVAPEPEVAPVPESVPQPESNLPVNEPPVLHPELNSPVNEAPPPVIETAPVIPNAPVNEVPVAPAPVQPEAPSVAEPPPPVQSVSPQAIPPAPIQENDPGLDAPVNNQ